jgi:hypothetical protein
MGGSEARPNPVIRTQKSKPEAKKDLPQNQNFDPGAVSRVGSGAADREAESQGAEISDGWRGLGTKDQAIEENLKRETLNHEENRAARGPVTVTEETKKKEISWRSSGNCETKSA